MAEATHDRDSGIIDSFASCTISRVRLAEARLAGASQGQTAIYARTKVQRTSLIGQANALTRHPLVRASPAAEYHVLLPAHGIRARLRGSLLRGARPLH